VDFGYSDITTRFVESVRTFMNAHVIPAEAVYEKQLREQSDPHQLPVVMA
jgi:acyl-CoA dehydrogenase